MKLSQATKDAKERIKNNNQKEPKEMKNHKTAITVSATVVATLLILAAFAATFYAGTQYQADHYENVKSEANELVTLKTERK